MGSHLRGVGRLVRYDDRRQRRIVANIPWIAYRPLQSENKHEQGHVYLQYWTRAPSPPDAIGLNPGFASQLAGSMVPCKYRKSRRIRAI